METAEVLTKTKWTIDNAHSHIDFKIRHLMISNVKGTFKEMSGSIYTGNEDFLTASIECSILVASIDTGDAKRDEHLKGPDFFDIENYKQITFTSNRFERAKIFGHYELYGELTMKGISKSIKMEVEFGGVVKDPWGNDKAGFSVNGSLNRKDWGLVWNTALETGGVVVGEEVKINCEIELLKAT